MPLFGGAVEPELYVYHYTTRQAALGSILPQRQLRLGPLAWTNDPRESQQWLVGLRGGPALLSEELNQEFFSIVRDADRLIRATTKVACLTRDDPDGMRSPHDEQFARGWAHSRMWAQYAGGHSGVCMMFDRARLERAMEPLREDSKLWSGPVLYANRPHIELGAAELDYEERNVDGLGITPLQAR
jgi:Protein of unknown function (DUF2971)